MFSNGTPQPATPNTCLGADNLADFDVLTLYQDEQVWVGQTTAGEFDKFGLQDLYGSGNFGLHVGDDGAQVLTRRARLLAHIHDKLANAADNSSQISSLHWLNQTHSDVVVDVDDGLLPQSADALVSSKAGAGLAIMTADCVPIALFARVGECVPSVACVHAGWQGLANGIVANAVRALRAKCDDGAQIFAVIGACIAYPSYEMPVALVQRIAADCAALGLAAQNGAPMNAEAIFNVIAKPHDNTEKCWLDVVALAKLELLTLGVQVLNDDVPCSYQDGRFYSYRAQTHAKKPAAGRMATIIVKRQ
ncbi:hypothetical protein B0181_05455 [Moraxella caviae]|nr:hypothetical protein B0181_05455 [Moraxella caviae]